MIRVLEGQDFATSAEFINALNAARLQHNGGWIAYVGTVTGKRVEIKTYGTGYLQILRVNGVTHPTVVDMNVTQWKNAITEAIAYEAP